MSHSIDDDFAEFFDHQSSTPTAMQLTAESTLELLAWLPADRYLITDQAGMPALEVFTMSGGFERVWLGDWIARTDDGVLQRFTAAQWAGGERR